MLENANNSAESNSPADSPGDFNPVAECALYLLPSAMSDGDVHDVLPAANIAIMRQIKHFVVENVRTVRRFLKRCDRSIDIDSLQFVTLDEHTDPRDVPSMLEPLSRGLPVGVISEAGCPAVADPGSDLVAVAQAKGFKVIPLVGPSSILLSLMGSGFNGQSFAFLGYLPHDDKARTAKFKEMERRIIHERQTQIFIETPYRNNRLVEQLCKSMNPSMKLCIATDITGPRQSIVTRELRAWKSSRPQLDKIPTIFLLFS